MEANFLKTSPLRRAQWRADRVMELADNPKLRPRRSDDDYVRSYRRFRILQNAAGIDETKNFAAYLKEPHSYIAEAIHYFGAHRDFRHVLEARLLTHESFAEIAKRLKIEEKTVVHYEALFFNVRDCLQNVEWIHELILDPRELLVGKFDGSMSEDQRGFLYRLFGYYGGPDVLDAVILSIGPTMMPERREDMAGWLDNALEQILQSWAAAASCRGLNTDSLVHLLELALGALEKAKKNSRVFRKRPPSDFEGFVARIVTRLTGRLPPRRRKTLKNATPDVPHILGVGC